MAVVDDQFVSTFTRTSFIKRPDPTRMFTSEPRAMVNFNVFAGTVSAKPVNDQQSVAVAIDLPIAFAYRMIELTCTVSQDVAPDWERGCFLEVTNGIRALEAGSVQRHATNSIATIRRTTTGMWIVNLDVPRYIIQSVRPQITPTITFEATNNNAGVGAAGVINFFASFFEYEIEQSIMYPVHNPVLTLGRS